MKRKLRFAVFFISALSLAPFLPLYFKRTMTWTDGGYVTWGLKFSTLVNYLSDYNYFRPEEKFFHWLAVNFMLALIYASLIALGIDRAVAHAQLRAGRGC